MVLKKKHFIKFMDSVGQEFGRWTVPVAFLWSVCFWSLSWEHDLTAGRVLFQAVSALTCLLVGLRWLKDKLSLDMWPFWNEGLSWQLRWWLWASRAGVLVNKREAHGWLEYSCGSHKAWLPSYSWPKATQVVWNQVQADVDSISWWVECQSLTISSASKSEQQKSWVVLWSLMYQLGKATGFHYWIKL